MDLCIWRYKVENPAEDPSEVLMMTMMIKVNDDSFQTWWWWSEQRKHPMPHQEKETQDQIAYMIKRNLAKNLEASNKVWKLAKSCLFVEWPEFCNSKEVV